MNYTETIFEKTIGRPRKSSATLLIGLVLFLIAFIVGTLAHGIPGLFIDGVWRGFFIYPSIIFYIFLIAPKLSTMENEVIEAILPLANLTEEKFNEFIEGTQVIRPLREWLAVGVGVGFITIIQITSGSVSFDLTGIYYSLMAATAFGILSWTIFASVLSVQVTAELLKQPLQVNLFDLSPYKVVGKSSLYLALAFIGGVTLALVFSAPDASVFQSLQFWLINMPMFLIPVIIFFWNMQPTHSIIERAKRKALKQTGQKIEAVSTRLMMDIERTSDTEQLSQTLQALLALEKRIYDVLTWPYEASTLRSLFGSVLIPIITVLIQVVLRRLLGL